MGDLVANDVEAPGGAVTQLLAAAQASDHSASNQLFELVYQDVRQIVGRHLHGAGRRGSSTTSLVHEALLRLARRDSLPFTDRVRALLHAHLHSGKV